MALPFAIAVCNRYYVLYPIAWYISMLWVCYEYVVGTVPICCGFGSVVHWHFLCVCISAYAVIPAAQA